VSRQLKVDCEIQIHKGRKVYNDPLAASAFVPALRDPDLQVELFAVGTLAQHPQESAIEPAMKRLLDNRRVISVR
jgi:hypothetical protein